MKNERPSTAYPFITKREVLERLDHDSDFVKECIAILHRRYVDRDSLTPPAGWMSSQVKAGEACFSRLSSDSATAADVRVGSMLATRYAKQLCKVFRDEQLSKDPGLAAIAAVFGVRRSYDEKLVDDGDDPYAETDEERNELSSSSQTPQTAAVESAPDMTAAPPSSAPESSSTTAEPAPAKRRPGRPKGSRNKPKEDRTKPSGKRGRRS